MKPEELVYFEPEDICIVHRRHKLGKNEYKRRYSMEYAVLDDNTGEFRVFASEVNGHRRRAERLKCSHNDAARVGRKMATRHKVPVELFEFADERESDE